MGCFGGCLIWLWKSYVRLPWPEFFTDVNQITGFMVVHLSRYSLNSCSSKNTGRKMLKLLIATVCFDSPFGSISVFTDLKSGAYGSDYSVSWASRPRGADCAHCEPSCTLFWSLHPSGPAFFFHTSFLEPFKLIFVLWHLKQIFILWISIVWYFPFIHSNLCHLLFLKETVIFFYLYFLWAMKSWQLDRGADQDCSGQLNLGQGYTSRSQVVSFTYLYHSYLI